MNVFDGCVLVLVSGCEENRSHGRSFGNPDGALVREKKERGNGSCAVFCRAIDDQRCR
jgi:hypothetical protein